MCGDAASKAPRNLAIRLHFRAVSHYAARMRAKLYVGNRNYSSWSIRGSLLVRQSGLDCYEIVIPLDMPESKVRIADVSPSGRVPVLHVDGLVVWDTLAIAEFLHERYPAAGLWPQSAAARALARSVSAEMHSSSRRCVCRCRWTCVAGTPFPGRPSFAKTSRASTRSG